MKVVQIAVDGWREWERLCRVCLTARRWRQSNSPGGGIRRPEGKHGTGYRGNGEMPSVVSRGSRQIPKPEERVRGVGGEGDGQEMVEWVPRA